MGYSLVFNRIRYVLCLLFVTAILASYASKPVMQDSAEQVPDLENRYLLLLLS